jgi:hypothetical protein
MSTKHCVVGLGEIGSALKTIFKADGEDPFKNEFAEERHYEFLHIAFPFNDSFVKSVEDYQKKYTPKYTIIHSTVPIGISELCDANHSPVRGVHPNLVDGILTFKKFVGGPDCWEIASEFKKFRISCMCVRESKQTEALKLIDTTQYGVMIMVEKQIHKFCEENKLDFNLIYTLANETYNEGYTKLFRPEVVRPYLKHFDEPLKGHCILENAILLRENGFDKDFIEPILAMGKHEDIISEEKPYLNKVWFYCEHIGKKRTLKDIGKQFSVTGENIGAIAKRNGWEVRNRKWTEEQLDKLIKMSGEMTFAEIAKVFTDKTYDAIRTKAIQLGIKSIYEPNEETKKEETRRKISASLQGISLKEWEGFLEDENSLIRKSDEYKKWRESVFQRDNYTCVKCNDKSGNGKTVVLNADHIKPFALYSELRTDINNGQTLCVKCHKIKTKEDLELFRNSKL